MLSRLPSQEETSRLEVGAHVVSPTPTSPLRARRQSSYRCTKFQARFPRKRRRRESVVYAERRFLVYELNRPEAERSRPVCDLCTRLLPRDLPGNVRSTSRDGCADANHRCEADRLRFNDASRRTFKNASRTPAAERPVLGVALSFHVWRAACTRPRAATPRIKHDARRRPAVRKPIIPPRPVKGRSRPSALRLHPPSPELRRSVRGAGVEGEGGPSRKSRKFATNFCAKFTWRVSSRF